MEKTFTQSVHYKIIIEGDYSCCNLWDEDLYQDANDFHDNVLDYVADNIVDYFHHANIILTDLKTVEDN